MLSLGPNRRIVSAVLVGLVLAFTVIYILPLGSKGSSVDEGPHERQGHLSFPQIARPRRSGPSPDEFMQPHLKQASQQPLTFVNRTNRARYGSVDVWRGDGVIPHTDVPDVEHPSFRPFQPPISMYPSPGEYLKQTLVADYPGPLTEKVFLMLKTGATVMWERLPIHLFTTLTRVKNFAIYSDLASSVSGYEVIDILKDMPQHVLEHEQLEMYRNLRDLHEQGLGGDTRDLKVENKGWDLDKFKNIPMLAHAYETSPDSEWFIFMDDDSYLFWGNIERTLAKLDSHEPFYFGSRAPFNFEIHGKNVPYFGHGGSGVIISKGAMDMVFGPEANRTHQELIDYYSELTLQHCCGDMMVAYMMFEEARVALTVDDPRWPWMRLQGEASYGVCWRKEMWCEPVLSFHHASTREIEYLWEYERLKNDHDLITYGDLYHDWMQPYIVEQRAGWLLWDLPKNNQRKFEGNDMVHDTERGYKPAESVANCERACRSHDDCVAWYQVEGTCLLHKGFFVRGLGTTPLHKHWPGSTPTSGWMIDRIREWRGEASCDSLRDDEKFSEGWFLRAKNAEKSPPSHVAADEPNVAVTSVTAQEPLATTRLDSHPEATHESVHEPEHNPEATHTEVVHEPGTTHESAHKPETSHEAATTDKLEPAHNVEVTTERNPA